jgi:phosphoribosylformimino-5-aminoimidazole carboxamide ribotide isomerase
MIIIPAIDLPHPGQPGPGKVREPRDVIREWEWLGFQRVQLVEPASRNDRPLNRRQAEELLRDVHIDVQVAGDIRSADDIEQLSNAGATSVVLGSRALDEPEWLASSVTSFPDLLVVETAARERRIRSRGLVRTLPVDVRDLADELSDLPLGGLLITFATDAPIEHADLALVEDLTERLPFPVLVGGGVQTLATLRDLEFRGVSATIIDAARLADTFDEQTLARSFVD